MIAAANIPIIKTGWFYLWLILLSMGIASEQQGYLDYPELFNQQLWQKATISTGSKKLIHVTDIRFDTSGLKKIQKLAELFPQTTFALMGNYSNSFINQLSNNAYQPLSKNLLLLSARRNSSVPALPQRPSAMTELMTVDFLNPIANFDDAILQTNDNIHVALQPDLVTGAAQLIWRNNNQYYPSFVGQVLINYEKKQFDETFTSIEFSLKNKIILRKKKYIFGYQGEFFPKTLAPANFSYESLLHSKNKTGYSVILIDDGSFKQSNLIAQSIASLVEEKYLYTNWLTLLAKYTLVILMLIIIYKMKKIVLTKQFAIFSLAVAFLFLSQWLLMEQGLWLSLTLILLLSSVSWLVQLGYSWESSIFTQKNDQQNDFFIDALPVFYQTKNIEKLLPHLEKCRPNHRLIDRAYEIAIEAEAHRNNLLAKRLHRWILTQDRKFSPSLERMSELSPALEENSDLGQTLVVDGQQRKTKPVVSGVLKIEKLGRYQVEGILGKGAMGIVYQGVDPKINRYVAIKTLQLNDELDGESFTENKQRFFREAETAGNLSHANIVTIYDVGEQQQGDSNRCLGYIAMDLLTGSPLSDYTKKGQLLPPSLVYQLMIQMADALDYAHRQKVIHRDIKPANIVYNAELQRGTLTDFGIAYMSDHSKTKTGTIMGSPYYMSPEQVIGSKVDGRSDIFSLGVTFYQLLSGELPFTGESIASVAFHITKTKHASVKQKNKKLAPSAARITNKALQKGVKKRYQSMQEFKQALINALKRDYKKSPLS